MDKQNRIAYYVVGLFIKKCMDRESDVQKILDRTDDGLKVFVHYLGQGCQNKTFRNPYRDDERPSCRLYYHLCKGGGGKWYFHDYGDMELIGQWIEGAPRYFLQRYVDGEHCIRRHFHEIPLNKALEFQKIIKAYVPNVGLRGYDISD